MPLFKKEKNSFSPKAKVYIPYKKSQQKPPKRKGTFSIGVGKKKTSRNNGKGIRKNFNIGFIFLYVLIPLTSIALLYVSAMFILKMRGHNTNDNYKEEYVIGLEDIPTYPESQFIFQNSIDEPSVAAFISSGNSAYRLNPEDNMDDVFAYYAEKLEGRGWQKALSVEVGSEEMKHGEYWVKEGQGLRIYSKFNDVWYELITYDQAITGLKELVLKEAERDLMLANQDLQDLLPDYPWFIKIPKEYIISYRVTNFENMRSVEFKKIGTGEKIVITPIGSVGKDNFDNFLRAYIEILNTDTESSWGITNTMLTYTSQGSALKGTISGEGTVHDVAVIPNSYDKVVYVIDSSTVGDPFFDYVLSNLQPQSLAKH